MKPCPETVNPKNRRWMIWVLLLGVVFLFAAIRIRLADIPLERDEGEYAYAGQLMLQGIPPYQLAYNMKLPGTYAAYAIIIKCFGESAEGIHLGLMVVNAATIVLLFVVATRLFRRSDTESHEISALVVAATYGLLSASPSVLGLAAHANHFVVFFAVLGLFFVSHPSESRRNIAYGLAGLAFGLSFLMKQQGLFFAVFGVLCVMSRELRNEVRCWKAIARRVTVFIIGFILPFGITCLLLWRAGVFSKFWFWTISYASAYASKETGSIGKNFLDGLSISVPPNEAFWLFGIIGALSPLFLRRLIKVRFFLPGLLVMSVVAFSAGFYFRQHYFILLLPTISLGMGAVVLIVSQIALSRSPAWRLAPMVLFVLLFSVGLLKHAGVFFQVSAAEASQTINGGNPFAETVFVADWIRKNSEPDVTIAVVGSEPQIYFHAARRSATGYIYTYALMENQPFAVQMQREMMQEIEKNQPAFMVFVGFSFSWLVRPESNKAIFNWFDDFSARHYERIGIVDYPFDQGPEFRWEGEALGHDARSNKYIYVFRRKES